MKLLLALTALFAVSMACVKVVPTGTVPPPLCNSCEGVFGETNTCPDDQPDCDFLGKGDAGVVQYRFENPTSLMKPYVGCNYLVCDKTSPEKEDLVVEGGGVVKNVQSAVCNHQGKWISNFDETELSIDKINCIDANRGS